MRETITEVFLLALGLIPLLTSSYFEAWLQPHLQPTQTVIAHRAILVIDWAAFFKLAVPSAGTLIIDVIVELKSIRAAWRS